MELAPAYLSAFSDAAYDVSRILLRFASALFLAHVLTFVLVAVLTWRPRSRQLPAVRERLRPRELPQRRSASLRKAPAPVPQMVATSQNEVRLDPIASSKNESVLK